MAVVIATAALAASTMPCPARSESVGDGAIMAAFHACAGQPVSVKARLQALNAANWVIAGNATPDSDLFALAFASGYKMVWMPGEEKQREAARAGGSARPLVSRVEPSDGADVKGARLPGGEPANVEAVVSYMGKYHGSAVLYYETADASAALRLLILPQGGLTSRYFLNCDLYLSTPFTLSEVDRLLPDGLKPADLRKERKYLNYEEHLIMYNTPSGFAGKLTYVDATELARLETHVSRYAPAAVLSSIFEFESRNVSMAY
ncbi:hypothetical protein [Albidovulum sp.]|uniref:hypothetical protein n=1 Tax=Albidovulum sp. TaxID=1872424 RepID=UPI0039B90D06